jgi:hypothetical protein
VSLNLYRQTLLEAVDDAAPAPALSGESLCELLVFEAVASMKDDNGMK